LSSFATLFFEVVKTCEKTGVLMEVGEEEEEDEGREE
jgi:hypothetical protein